MYSCIFKFNLLSSICTTPMVVGFFVVVVVLVLFFFCPNKYALSGQIYTVELGFVYPVIFVSAATESQSV